MKQHDIRYAMMSREWGLRRVRRLTWGIAGAGAVGAIALVVGFGGHVHVPKLSQPARAPAGTQGSSGQPANQVPSGQLQPPAANPVPAQGPGQVVSGGS
jgi:hypothetical protein